MIKNPLVTIPTTTYDRSKYIANCVKSVLAQTFDDLEQVIGKLKSLGGMAASTFEFDLENAQSLRGPTER
jgi:hypothetical protein